MQVKEVLVGQMLLLLLLLLVLLLELLQYRCLIHRWLLGLLRGSQWFTGHGSGVAAPQRSLISRCVVAITIFQHEFKRLLHGLVQLLLVQRGLICLRRAV